MDITVKKCRKCGKLKSILDFYRKRSKKDGHQSVCKDCANTMVREYKRRMSSIKLRNKPMIEDLKDEEWRDVVGYEGLYKVSNLGRVKRIYFIHHGVSSAHYVYEKLRIPQVNKHGYLMVSLWKNNRYKNMTVHRLVATAFIPNPNNYPYINHIDSNRANPKADNLEWCTQSQNMRWAYDTNNMRDKLNPLKGANHRRSVKVNMLTLNEELIKTFACITDAAREMGLSVTSISNCLHGRAKTSGVYIWRI